jgi:NAD(P)-dependent dehydrogenase (short-subunit alcohol dehydrogenase family)
MELGLRDRRALVTGSTAGIGFATARLLAGEGAEVVINGRTAERVNRAIERIREDFPSAPLTGVAADLGTARGCAEVIERVPSVDILVNNVGIFEPKPFEEIPDEDWVRFFEVNVLSGVRLTRHYLSRMRIARCRSRRR